MGSRWFDEVVIERDGIPLEDLADMARGGRRVWELKSGSGRRGESKKKRSMRWDGSKEMNEAEEEGRWIVWCEKQR